MLCLSGAFELCGIILELSARYRLAKVNEKLAILERKMELIEAKALGGEA